MAFFALNTMSIAFIIIGSLMVVGVIVIVALKIFHQNKEEQQVEIARHGMQLSPSETYTVGKNIAEGKYSFSADSDQKDFCLTLNGEAKTMKSGDVLQLSEDDVLRTQISVVATICK